MKNKNDLIFIGTNSNAGKTFITGFIGKIIKDKLNINCCPFKAQNMSNYATVCEDSKEISIAQASQAELMKVIPSADMNPVLLKPLGEGNSQLVVRGVPQKIINARTYYQDIEALKPEVDVAYANLKKQYDMILIEGAGSAFELNLHNRDIANKYMMQKENINSILVANIDNGGIFPAILGASKLMTEEERAKFKGVIINNFRGDISLFGDGKSIIESWGIPVLGIIPHIEYGIDCEDSLSTMSSSQRKIDDAINIGVIKYPKIANINDLEPLMHDPNVLITFINQNTNLDIFDKIILPGSKAVIDDLQWLNKTGLYNSLKSTKSEIYGICGGYQMLHEKLIDKFGSENSKKQPISLNGLGLITGCITFENNKILKRQEYQLFNAININGFEMHTGISNTYPVFFNSNKIKGSFIHEIFTDDNFRNWWLETSKNIKIKNWKYIEWKTSLQNKVSSIIEDNINLEKIIG